ncbi:YbhB/YbcL family Raf kinase inhibitor-like protein [Roseovarius salis]|uniref:YbhB/YbcL family Raf kinase inhibitor-like protein n=1 Tax=Roseovarius salis TaxID=3376063 RepID=UPI0037C8FC1F
MLMLTSPDFAPGEPIPQRFTCDGQNVSPAFRWAGVPEGTEELILVCEDPDAPRGPFLHWAAYGISPSRDFLHAGYADGADAPGFHQAVNDFGKAGYGGPCPPVGDAPHSYRFRLSAHERALAGVSAGTTCREIVEMATPHVIDSAEIIGVYARARPAAIEQERAG